MSIKFNLIEFKNWLTKIGCDDCGYFVNLEKNEIIHKYRTYIQDVITDYRDIELVGEISE